VQSVHKNNIVLVTVYLFVLSVSDHNCNNDVIFHCVVSRRMQMFNHLSCSTQYAAVGTGRTTRLRDENALEVT
jgi:hypothetical protein